MSKQMIDEGHLRFLAAMRANDADALMRELADDVAFMPPGEEPVRGKEAVRAWYEGVVAQAETTGIDVTNRHVVVDGELGIEHGRFEWDLRPNDGGDPFTARGHFCAEWRARGDRWEVVWDMWNSMDPAP
jgi:ketosteroid isomerase-like protein